MKVKINDKKAQSKHKKPRTMNNSRF